LLQDQHERELAQPPEDIRPLHELCRDGHLYDVERWIADSRAPVSCCI